MKYPEKLSKYPLLSAVADAVICQKRSPSIMIGAETLGNSATMVYTVRGRELLGDNNTLMHL